METLVETIEHKGCTIEVHYDHDPQSPREWDNLGTMTCLHGRYTLGDSHDFKEAHEIEQHIKAEKAVSLPLYLFDHSGITMNTTGFSCPWDSGQVGMVYVSREKLLEEHKWKRLTKKRIKQVETWLKGEVETYDAFISGQVYGYILKDADGEETDSCWGYFGQDYMVDEVKSLIDARENRS